MQKGAQAVTVEDLMSMIDASAYALNPLVRNAEIRVRRVVECAGSTSQSVVARASG